MNNLIKITEKNGRQLVSARELYEFLGFDKSQFARWSKKNIVNNQFAIENEDWTGFDINVEGNTLTDYAVSLDFAKKITLVSKSVKGNEIREYFIECEKQLRNGTVKLPTPTELAYMLIQSESEKQIAQEQVRLLTETVKQQAPKVEYVETVLQAVNTWPITLIAAELGKSAIALNQILKEKGIHRKVNGVWVLNADYCNKGYTGTRTHNYTDTLGRPCTSQLTVWTEKGREFIHGLVNEKLNKSLTHA